MCKMYDIVMLIEDCNHYKKGTSGAIVEVLDEKKGIFIVELFDENNNSIGLEDLYSSQFELKWSYIA